MGVVMYFLRPWACVGESSVSGTTNRVLSPIHGTKSGAEMYSSCTTKNAALVVYETLHQFFTDISFIPRYENPEISLHCGMILRECIRYEPLARRILSSDRFYSLFGYVEMSTFDIASDAFTTFKVFT